MASFSVMSLNCHRFNVGTAAYLHRACKSVDVILLQETWLSDINCSKISESMSDFDVFHTSAMEHKLSTGFWCGRPYGGTAVLIRKSFSLNSCKVVTNSLCLSAVCRQFTSLSVLYCCLSIGIASCNVPFDGKINLVAAFLFYVAFDKEEFCLHVCLLFMWTT